MKLFRSLCIASLYTLPLLSMVSFGKTYTVRMFTDFKNARFYYDPKDLTIQIGDTVVWINTVDDGHNVVSDCIPKKAHHFESKMLRKNEKFSYTFTINGTYDYHCHPHASTMKARIIVGKPSVSGSRKPSKHTH